MIVGTVIETEEVVRIERVEWMWVCGGGCPKFIVSKTPHEVIILLADQSVEKEAVKFTNRLYPMNSLLYGGMLRGS